MKDSIKMWWYRQRQEILWFIAKNMPKSIRYWCVVFACSQATTGKYGNTVPDELSIMEMLKRIE
jgi:hypothetical protein